MGLNLDLLSILGKLPADNQLVLDDHILQGGNVASAGSCWRLRISMPGPDACCLLLACQSGAMSSFCEGEQRTWRRFWRVLGTAMMQGGWGAQTIPIGTIAPACGARGDRPIFAAFARFSASDAALFAFCYELPLSRKSLPLC